MSLPSQLKWIFCLCLIVIFGKHCEIDASNSEDVLQTKFQKILLVIHYNHEHYKSIDFLKKIYSPLFPNIVFYGPQSHPEITAVYTDRGQLFSRVVTHALKSYPGYQGYIFLQDDCFMNFWNYARLSNDKIWFCQNQSDNFFHATLAFPITDWPWWNNKGVGLKKARKAVANLNKKEKKLLYKNHGEDHVVAQMCDMFYIPARLSSRALRLSEVFKDVFVEIAIPTLLSCIEDIHQWEKLHYLWTGNCEATIDLYDPSYDWVHPIKFSQEYYQRYVEELIETYSTTNLNQ